MSEQTTIEKVKYGLLKAIDVSGFRVFDPVVRLLFGEEPKKQLGDIGRYMLMPIVFVCCCMLLWNFIAPRHKTKSGEVPTPAQVWNAMVVQNTIHQRENEKEADFEAEGDDIEARITEVNSLIAEKRTTTAELLAESDKLKTENKQRNDEAIKPLQKEYDELKAANKKEKADRKEEAAQLAKAVAAKNATTDELLEFLRTDIELNDAAKKSEKEIKDKIDEIRSAKPKPVKAAELAADSAATELQFLSKRIDYLSTGNRSVKVADAQKSTAAAISELDSSGDAAKIGSAAKSVVKGQTRVEKIAAQSYPRQSTIWLQTWRSLFTVFIGFLLAAVVAIPIGIMCGLNKVVMACLTPIISVFKPVSPVVWLLIFQIVVGAFFPNPETHPLFVFFNSLPVIKDLSVNPALIYSACTVAMCAVWPALVNTALGVSSVEQDHINVAKVLKLGLWSRLTKIIIPSSLPLVFAGLRISLGVGWMVLIAAEALSSSNGLGKFVWDEYQNGGSMTFANILFACFLIGGIGFILDRMMIVLQRSVSFEDGAATV